MNMAMALNFGFIMAILQRILWGYSFYDFKVDIFWGQSLDIFVSFFVLYLLPPLTLNYFLIFRNQRYEMLLTKYKFHEGKLFNKYFLISLFGPLCLVFIGKILGHSE